MTRQLASKPRSALGAVASCVAALWVATLSPNSFALSFGAEQVTSYLGQPLRLAIPLLGATGDSLEPRCFRVVTPSRNDGLTVISQARIELQTSSNPPLLIIRSNRSVDDPVVRVSVEAGCDSPIRRDYTLLVDPQPLQVAETTRPAPVLTPPLSSGANVDLTVAVAPASLDARASTTANVAESSQPARAARVKAAAAKASDRAGSADSPRNVTRSSDNVDRSLRLDRGSATKQQDQLRVQEATGAGSAGVGDASLAALAVPRLKIASDLPSFEPAQPGAARTIDELQVAIASERRARLLNAPIEEDLSPRLEADLVVAKRRLAELQLQLSAAGLTAKPESAAVGAAAVANAKGGHAVAPVQSGWNWREWVWVPGVLLVLGLLGFLLRQKRAQSSADTFSTAPPTLRDDQIFEQTLTTRDRSSPVIGVAPAVMAPAVVPEPKPDPLLPTMTHPLGRPQSAVVAEREASDRLNNPLFQLRDTTRHVDVTELSQVTDEAQVYVDLGRSDQAIEILRDHIEQQAGERDSPAAWLMIFELYRHTNNRAGYDELAPKFRTHFNGRMPDWDNYGHELALDDGLEAFPHLVAMLQRDWGTADARTFLEELLYDNRGGSRLGFSLAAYRDILLLLQLHEALDGEQADLASIIDWESRGANDDDGTPKWDLSLEMLDPPKVGELESFLRNRPPDDKSS